ncbi:MAG: leucine-rich repeat domain-containing protein [Candidatus Marinamargulisbacteria bacterium]
MEAPNRIKLTPLPPTGSSSPLAGSQDAHTFRQLLAHAAHPFEASPTEHSPPTSPKKGIVWFEMDAKTPDNTTPQQMKQLTTPGLLKWVNVSPQTHGFNDVMTTVKQSPHMRHLILRRSNLHAHQMATVARVLTLNDGMAWLVLDHNQLNDTQLGAFTDALESSQGLTHMVLSNNRIGDGGVRQLMAKLPQLPTLKTLWLSNNQISDLAIPDVLQAIKDHPTIETVALDGNRLSLNGKKQLFTACDAMGCRCYV